MGPHGGNDPVTHDIISGHSTTELLHAPNKYFMEDYLPLVSR